MSHSSQLMEITGSVDFESNWNLQITAQVLSTNLFSGIPFSEEIAGLRDEVPAVKLTKELFGLTFVLHGQCAGERCHFTLTASPGPTLFEHLVQHGATTVDVGKWLAQLVGILPEFRVTGHSPS